MADSGVKRWRVPSKGLRKSTPSSSTRRMSLRLKTWKPPLSVRMGRSQAMKPWMPPNRSISSAPGRK